VDWLTAVGLGACGGAVVQAASFYVKLQAWQTARLKARTTQRSTLPLLTFYVDPLADILVFFTRLGLGALAGGIFHAQVSGVTATIAVGAAAPALLSQFGTARGLAGLGTHDGTDASARASTAVTDLGSLAKEG
jgi:hypothetical protein